MLSPMAKSIETMNTIKALGRRLIRRPAQPKRPLRQWFTSDDGPGYYRNCPLIMAERDEVMAWPLATPGKQAVLDDLFAEFDETFQRGVQHKAELGPGDIAIAS
jgi:hypothetical protein